MQLHLLCGIPGCGKSSLAKSLSGYIISTDQLRKFLWDDESVFKYDKLVFRLIEMIAKYMLSIGKDVIIDSTNITINSRKKYIDIARRYGAKVTVHWVDCQVDKAIEQNALRERNVPEVVIYSMNKSFQPPNIDEGIDTIMIYHPDLGLESVIES